MVQGGEAAAGVKQRRRLHGETFEEGAPPEKQNRGTKNAQIVLMKTSPGYKSIDAPLNSH